jgi:type I restriction enzyme S subunit
MTRDPNNTEPSVESNHVSELPMGWELGKLEDLTLDPKNHIVDGPFGSNLKASEYLEEGIPIVRLQNIDRNFFIDKNIKFISHEKANLLKRHSFIKGDIIITKLEDPLGKACLVPDNLEGGIIVADVVRVRPDERFSSKRYLVYLINSQVISNQLLVEVKGTTRPRVNLSHIRHLQIPIALLNEQRRIVAKLDSLFTHSRRTREELERIPKLIQRYKQALLEAAFCGDLTADWREDNPISENAKDLLIRLKQQQGIIRELVSAANLHRDRSYAFLPSNWCWAQVEDIGQVFLGRQRSPKNHNGSNMRPYVRAANITWNGWDISDIKEMNFDDRDFRKYKLQPGDVLINEGSGSADEVGKPAIWNNEIENCCFQNTLICVRPFESMSRYLYLVFLHAARSKIFVEETRGVNIFHIGKERLSQFKFALPPIAEQKEIVQRVEKLFKTIDLMEQEYQKAGGLCDRLEQATLAKAFRGELVPQNPDDEPASVLLERIRSEREAQPRARR